MCETYFGGNIGYAVKGTVSRQRLCRKACKLVFEIARQHGMLYVIISCRADNLPSRKTLEKLNGTLLETRVPASYSSLYRIGERDPHCYFQFDL
ncbi:MAG: hypothetical protein R2881_02260 [Eubacteriales bacterium]